MLIPNTTGVLARRTGTDQYAQGVYAASVTVPCAVVRLNTKVKPTPVRSEESASRGDAEEEVSNSIILFPASVGITDEDKFTINGIDLRCSSIQTQYDVFGNIDHLEASFELWQS